MTAPFARRRGLLRWRCAAVAASFSAFASLTEAETEGQTEVAVGDAEHVRLLLQVDAARTSCPGVEQVSAWVNQLAGREYVQADAQAVILVVVEREGTAPLGARVYAVAEGTPEVNSDVRAEPSISPEPKTAKPTLLRQLQHDSDCYELLKATALTLSVMAPHMQTDGSAAASATTPVPTPTQPAIEPRARSENATADAPVSEPSASPVTAVSRPAPVHSEHVPTAPRVQPPAKSAAKTQKIEASQPGVSRGLRAQLNASVASALGANPGGALGGLLGASVLAPGWSVRVAGEYLASGSVALEGDERVRGNSMQLEAALCWWPLPAWRACGAAGNLWLFARGDGFGLDHAVTRRTPVLGAEVGFAWPLLSHLDFDSGVGLALPTAPVELRVLGPEATGVWAMSPVALRLRIGLSVQ